MEEGGDRAIYGSTHHHLLPPTQVSDRTYKSMCDHIMGGKRIIPGSFFSEMALEAGGGLPLTITNVEYRSMLRVSVRPLVAVLT